MKSLMEMRRAMAAVESIVVHVVDVNVELLV